jgi:transcriptional regulator with XRE-family HTH domain
LHVHAVVHRAERIAHCVLLIADRVVAVGDSHAVQRLLLQSLSESALGLRDESPSQLFLAPEKHLHYDGSPSGLDPVTDGGRGKHLLLEPMRTAVPTARRRQRDETDRFRIALLRLRGEREWSQPQLAARLGVSKRTLSNWECGYWLPPFKQRLHIVLALRDAPPEHVLAIADGLGVSVDPAVTPFLQPFRDALDPPPVVEVVAPVAPVAPPLPSVAEPPRPRVEPQRLREAMDSVVRDAADGMNVAANDLRAALGRAIATCGELGGTLEEMREAVLVKGKGRVKAG